MLSNRFSLLSELGRDTANLMTCVLLVRNLLLFIPVILS